MTTPDESQLAEVLIRALEKTPLEAPLLVAGDPTGRILAWAVRAVAEPDDARAEGGVTVWTRRASASRPHALPWPEPGPYRAALLRLPKSREELAMSLHAVASVVVPGGRIWVYGANAEGARSAEPHIARVLDAVQTVETRGHARVMVGERPERIAGLRADLAHWRRTVPSVLAGGTVNFVTYPGLFAKGALDPATALLIGALPKLSPGSRFVDFGCGSGIVARAILARSPGTAALLIDNDAVAIAAVRENVPGADARVACDLTTMATRSVDLVVSNPPIHDGKSEDHAVIEKLIGEAPRVLRVGGTLLIVVQRRVGAAGLMRAAFGNVEQVAVGGAFEVLRARAEPRPAGRREGTPPTRKIMRRAAP